MVACGVIKELAGAAVADIETELRVRVEAKRPRLYLTERRPCRVAFREEQRLLVADSGPVECTRSRDYPRDR